MREFNNPRVSIILPTYNGEETIARALDSIAAQTFRDFETILIDNNCTDNTIEIAKRYEAKTSANLKIVKCEIPGIVPALNTGLWNARGSLIARQDDDDYWYPTKLEKQVNFLDENSHIHVLGTQNRIIDKSGRILNNGNYGVGEFGMPAEVLNKPAKDQHIKKKLIIGECPICHPSVIIRKEKLLLVGGYENQFHRAEDMHLWVKLIPYCNFANLKETLVDYTEIKKSDDNPHVSLIIADMYYQLYKAMGIISGDRPSLEYQLQRERLLNQRKGK